jgi:uncharacterized membrane protein
MTKIHFLFLFVVMAGCNYSIPKTQDTTSGNQTIQKLPTGTIPGYQTIASGIIAPKCLGCHSSGGGNAGGVNLESYAKVSSYLAAISSAITSGSMPKNISPLTAKEKEVFLAWIDAGGPLNSPTPIVGSTEPTPAPIPVPVPTPVPAPAPAPTEVMPDPNTIDYKMVNARVIGLRCISCHSNSGGNSAGINLETYESVFNERSGIKSVISSGAMPLPRNRPLTTIQKQILLTWLNKGAPETLP